MGKCKELAIARAENEEPGPEDFEEAGARRPRVGNTLERDYSNDDELRPMKRMGMLKAKQTACAVEFVSESKEQNLIRGKNKNEKGV